MRFGLRRDDGRVGIAIREIDGSHSDVGARIDDHARRYRSVEPVLARQDHFFEYEHIGGSQSKAHGFADPCDPDGHFETLARQARATDERDPVGTEQAVMRNQAVEDAHFESTPLIEGTTAQS